MIGGNHELDGCWALDRVSDAEAGPAPVSVLLDSVRDHPMQRSSAAIAARMAEVLGRFEWPDDLVVVPVPTSELADVLARALASLLEVPYERALRRRGGRNVPTPKMAVRPRVAPANVLLVDDVQFLAGKDGTQEEFFHTFNALHDTHRQIVLTADRKPREISDIADRLRTRFAWGLLADIEPPELEVRIAILRKKAAAESVQLPDDVALYIASSIKSNVRELEGALIRLAAYASLSRRNIDLDFAQETLGAAITGPREVITVEAVIKTVANYYGLKVSDIKSPRRHKSISSPRAIAMYLSRQHTKDSYPDLGRSFGGKHHTTVISAVEKIAERLKDDPALRSELHAIEAALQR